MKSDAVAESLEHAAAEPPLPPAAPVVGRERMRLMLLVAMVGVWASEWGNVQVGGGSIVQSGGTRTGLLAAAALLVLWGLTATSLSTRTLRGLRAGLALVSALVALTATWLLATDHPWIPGGELRSSWAPVFACLALMAVLEAVVVLRAALAGAELAWMRAACALAASAGLFVADAKLPAALALWLGATAVANAKITSAVEARRALEVCALIAAVLTGFAPILHPKLIGLPGLEVGLPNYAWAVLSAIIATTAVDGVLRPVATDLDDAQ